jgi:hypothetical protein
VHVPTFSVSTLDCIYAKLLHTLPHSYIHTPPPPAPLAGPGANFLYFASTWGERASPALRGLYRPREVCQQVPHSDKAKGSLADANLPTFIWNWPASGTCPNLASDSTLWIIEALTTYLRFLSVRGHDTNPFSRQMLRDVYSIHLEKSGEEASTRLQCKGEEISTRASNMKIAYG